MYMKTFLRITLFALALLIGAPCIHAQKSDKQLKKELKQKADKTSRKEAKAYTKQGWEVMPGRLPLEKQLQESKYSQIDKNENGARRYFTGSHEALGGNYSAAKQIADNRAHLELAQQIYNEISRLIKDKVSNENYKGKNITAIDEFISANKGVVEGQLQGIESVLEMYKKRSDGTYEVRVFARIDAEKAMLMSKKGYYTLLKQKSEELAKELDEIL